MADIINLDDYRDTLKKERARTPDIIWIDECGDITEEILRACELIPETSGWIIFEDWEKPQSD